MIFLLLHLILNLYLIFQILLILLFSRLFYFNLLILLLIALLWIYLNLIFWLLTILLLIIFLWILNSLCFISFYRIQFVCSYRYNLLSLFQLLLFFSFLFYNLSCFFTLLISWKLFIYFCSSLILILLYRIIGFDCCIFLRRFLRFLSFGTCLLIILPLIFYC